MYILVAYDVSVSTPEGRRRLRRVAKTCLDYGQRVQNSVFECKIEAADFVFFRERILNIIDLNSDSVRFYNLGEHWERKVSHYGVKASYNVDGPLIV